MSDDTEVKIYSLDDLQVSPELLMRAKVFKKAKLREEYEILIPDEESDILLRDLKSSPFRKQAERLVSLYLESDANVDYLAQNQFYDSYFNITRVWLMLQSNFFPIFGFCNTWIVF